MSEGLFTLNQARDWIGQARLMGGGSTPIARVHTDTRSLMSGDLFVALRGERFDANEFLGQAAASGAAAVVCHEAFADQAQALGLPALVVNDSLQALGALAHGWRQQFSLPLIAVTGSNGKTTVTQMIGSILRAAVGDAALTTQGNLNNEVGVPLTLLRLRPQHRLAVVELGMNHPGEIARLAAMTAPTVALVNNAQREHQEFMQTVQAVAQENGAVVSALPAAGLAVFPSDDAFTSLWTALAAKRGQLSFALDGTTEPVPQVYCHAMRWVGAAWQVVAHTPQGPVRYRLGIAGRHNVKNSLAAMACALAAGVPIEAIEQGLSGFEPVKGRSRTLLSANGLTLIDDSYNANPDSVRAAIDLLAELPAPRLLVLGDMGEVGEQGPQFHAEVGQYAQSRGIEQLMTLGRLAAVAAQAFGAAQSYQDIDALRSAVLQRLPQMRSVLVKGSRSMQMERVVAAIESTPQPAQEELHAD
jgi:UDP-N-acetylmuramoyl-tripeptide--D-alanyl-D-alanine ligase